MSHHAPPRRSARALPVALAVALALSLLGWSLVVRYAFPHGDDFLHATAGAEPGDVRTLPGWLASWSFDHGYRNGRAADAVARLVLATGRTGAAVVAVLVMVLTGLASWAWVRRAAPGTHALPLWVVLGAGVPFLTVQGAPRLTGEGILWVSGLANYALSTLAFLVAALAVSGLLPRRLTWWVLPVVVYAHLGHEVGAVATAVVTVLALLLRRPADPARWAAVGASGVGFVLLVTAPGLWRRTEETELALPLLQALSRTTVLFASMTLWWWLALGTLAVAGILLQGRRPRAVVLLAGSLAWVVLWLVQRSWPVISALCADPDTGVPTAPVALASVLGAATLVAAVLVLVVQAWGADRAYPVVSMAGAAVIAAGVPIVASVCGERAYFLPMTALVLATVCALRLLVDTARERSPGARPAAGASVLVVLALLATLVLSAGYVMRASDAAAANAAGYRTFLAQVDRARATGQGQVVVPDLAEPSWVYARGFYLRRYACDIRHFYGLPDGVVLTDSSGRERDVTEETTGCTTTWQRTLSRAPEGR
ncbi:DUF6056 family protein [Serinicoccus sp. LYQ131]|uniref:DUF6056 family protein n=1 Tax=Serinicoccus sp. LYQ131 TaxID=3378797 RepID=UPI00385344B1